MGEQFPLKTMLLQYPQTKEERKRMEYRMEIIRTVGAFATMITLLLNTTLFIFQVRIATEQVKHINKIEVIK